MEAVSGREEGEGGGTGARSIELGLPHPDVGFMGH